MLKITAYAQAQLAKPGKKDGWGFPRQTIYLKQTRNGGKILNYREIADYQRDFMTMLENLINKHPTWATKNGWDKLDKIYNDPVSYSTRDLIEDTRKHYNDGHDAALSMILRQQYLIRKLAQDIGDASIIKEWDIDLTIKNPDEPVLKKFYDRDVLTKTAQPTGTAFGELFS